MVTNSAAIASLYTNAFGTNNGQISNEYSAFEVQFAP